MAGTAAQERAEMAGTAAQGRAKWLGPMKNLHIMREIAGTAGTRGASCAGPGSPVKATSFDFIEANGTGGDCNEDPSPERLSGKKRSHDADARSKVTRVN